MFSAESKFPNKMLQDSSQVSESEELMNMVGAEDDYEEEETPMLQASPHVTVEHAICTEVFAIDDHKKTIRTGTLWTTIAHIITAVIGSGVLSLAWSVSQLGWIGGPVALICFALVTYVSSSLLSDCYRSPDPVTGTRNCSYIDAVRVILGEKQAWLCGFLQYLNFYGTGVAYVVTTSTCMSMVWISVIAAIMSFCYSTIGFGLGVAKVIENGKIYGSITGVPTISAPLKTWLAFQALGDIAFAYPYSIVFLEIQDTVKSPPSENKTMKRASAIAILVTTFFYLGCACTGYAAFGNDTPGNLLTGFGFYEPYWLIDFANACIILHLIGGYQLYSQPVFAYAERWLTGKFPGSGFLNKFYGLKLPFLPHFQLNLFRLSFRTSYVVSTTGIAMAFPYFNEILGLLGGLNLWPLAIYFPVEMYIVQRKIESWSRKWVVLQIFSSLLMVVSAMAFIGSVAGVIEAKMS
ncbi:probable amino acid permease 7 isoform X2 [Cynara cardunculus var. scolymus]|uniref:probable amino acid permease 7 isoform X2 n=1 Tax=Cynara cardunculus var. scolymus TaxID=59895 RepID=UPI000D6234CE|nr:probable amino acid permease 7 isoform X2 [Cynara cardunculus var. scolymus]